VREDPECVGFIPPDEGGALQISAFVRPTGDVPIEELERAAETVGADVAAWQSEDLRGFAVAFVRDGAFWQKWWIGSGPHTFFLTWNEARLEPSTNARKAAALVRTLKLRAV
jgi:hypothetical protein